METGTKNAKPKVVDQVWHDPKTAEAAARKDGGELWRGHVIITFGKYAGKSFRWLLESDVGYVKWLLVQFIQRGEVYPLLKWEKQTLLDYTKDFAPVMCHVHSEMKVSIFILLCDL